MVEFILEASYPSGRASANVLKFVWLCVSGIQTGTRRVTHLDERNFEMRNTVFQFWSAHPLFCFHVQTTTAKELKIGRLQDKLLYL